MWRRSSVCSTSRRLRRDFSCCLQLWSGKSTRLFSRAAEWKKGQGPVDTSCKGRYSSETKWKLFTLRMSKLWNSPERLWYIFVDIRNWSVSWPAVTFGPALSSELDQMTSKVPYNLNFSIIVEVCDIVRKLPCSWYRIQKNCLHNAKFLIESTKTLCLWHGNSADHSNIKNILFSMCLTSSSLLNVTQLTLSEVLSINLSFIRKLVVKDLFWIGSDLVCFIVQAPCWQVDPSHRHLVLLAAELFSHQIVTIKAGKFFHALPYNVYLHG